MQDVDKIRIELPEWSEQKLDIWTVMKSIGGLIGKDLSQMVLPITLYEPMTTIMKPAEQMFFYDRFTDAAKATDKPSSYRMALVALSLIQGYFVVPNRTGKPINP